MVLLEENKETQKFLGSKMKKGKNMIEQRETAKAQSQGLSNWDDRRLKHLLLPLKKEIEWKSKNPPQCNIWSFGDNDVSM